MVVAIIALLVAIMLPGLSAARERGRRAKCASNLRQVAIGWTLYLDDDAKGVFPWFQRNIHWFYGGKIDAYKYPQLALNPRPLNRYVGADPYGNRTAELFHCPSDRGIEDEVDPSWAGRTTYDYYGNSYPMNSSLLVHPWNRPVRLVDIHVPLSIVILAGDHQSVWGPFGPGLRAFWHDDHGLSMNLGFLDGHAAFVRLEREIEQTSSYSYAIDWLEPEEPPPSP